MYSNEEDATVVCLWQFLQLCEEEDCKKRKRYWMHPINEKRVKENILKRFIEELRKDESKFINFTRLNIECFNLVLNAIQDRIKKDDTNLRKSITPEERLIVTLRYLALGERFQSLHYYFRLGASTISSIVKETYIVIWEELAPVYMKQPTSEEWLEVAEKFDRLWNFPNCLGAIDGKHIRIECPYNAGSAYFNYKSFHSIILQAVTDADCKFLFVDVGDYGRNSDSGVFRNSNFGKLLFNNDLHIPSPRPLTITTENLPFVFVGDEAYPLLTNVLRPFPRRQLTSEKRIFNYRLSRARRVVECSFGMLTKRFRVLENAMLLNPENATSVTLACCILHNIIRETNGTASDIHEELLHTYNTEYTRSVNTNRSNAGLNSRNEFLHYFNSNEGSVPWQNKYAHAN